MSIVKRPLASVTKTAEDFIQGAPDAAQTDQPVAASTKGVMLGRQQQISFAMPPELLAKVDATAHKLSITRAAFMKLAITRAVQAEAG